MAGLEVNLIPQLMTRVDCDLPEIVHLCLNSLQPLLREVCLLCPPLSELSPAAAQRGLFAVVVCLFVRASGCVDVEIILGSSELRKVL